MPKGDPQKLKEALADVAHEANAPKVVFPHGFKIIEVQEERVLCPMTPDEYRGCLEEEGIEYNEEDAGYFSPWYCVCVH
jgi:hypothetical protein